MINADHSIQTLDMQLPLGSLETYICRVNQIPMLTAEQEQFLAKKFREENDLGSARELVMSHLRFVVKIARGYLGYGLPLGDLIQEGNVGLMKAVKRFDPSVGVRLVSFAVHWIKAEMHEYVLRNWRIVKVATTKAQRKCFFKLRNAKKRLGWSTPEEVTAIANDLGVPEAEVMRMEARLNAHDVTFDHTPELDNDDHHHYSPSDYLHDDTYAPAAQIEKMLTTNDEQQKLLVAFQHLDDRSQDILRARWLSDEKATLHTLADKYQVSAERIRQLEKNAMNKIKKEIEAMSA